jgi:hypothetical protein
MFIHHARLDPNVKLSKTTQESSGVDQQLAQIAFLDREDEKADMKYLFRLIDLDPQQQRKLGVLSAQKVLHYYTMIK